MDFVPDGERGQFPIRYPGVLGDDVVRVAILDVDGAQAVADVNEESAMDLGRVGEARPFPSSARRESPQTGLSNFKGGRTPLYSRPQRLTGCASVVYARSRCQKPLLGAKRARTPSICKTRFVAATTYAYEERNVAEDVL